MNPDGWDPRRPQRPGPAGTPPAPAGGRHAAHPDRGPVPDPPEGSDDDPASGYVPRPGRGGDPGSGYVVRPGADEDPGSWYRPRPGVDDGPGSGYVSRPGPDGGPGSGYVARPVFGSGQGAGYVARHGVDDGPGSGYLSRSGPDGGLGVGYAARPGPGEGPGSGYVARPGPGDGPGSGYLARPGVDDGPGSGYVAHPGPDNGPGSGYTAPPGRRGAPDQGAGFAPDPGRPRSAPRIADQAAASAADGPADGPSTGPADHTADEPRAGQPGASSASGRAPGRTPTGPRRQDLADARATQRVQTRRKRRRTGVVVLAVLLLLAAIGGGGLYVYTTYLATPDFEGDGTGDILVQVEAGDSTTQIGAELNRRGVVASVAAFTEAAADDDRIRSVQPGYYHLRSQMSGASAVTLLLDPDSRVGQLEIRGGVQLDDTRAPDGTVAPGVLSLIARATCMEQDGQERCLTVDDLRRAMTDTDPAALGVPEWALEDVGRAEPARRLEGLLVPGRYDVQPGQPAADVLRELLASSATRLEASGLVAGAQAIGASPYDALTIASLVEKEAINPDMPKVARVIYNRLGAGRRLELDSMVNYPLDLQALRTTAADRTRPGPYNSYTVAGLPPTPIAAAGREAINAALRPENGPWLYFVRCQTDGTSCFAATFDEHAANVREARANGAF